MPQGPDGFHLGLEDVSACLKLSAVDNMPNPFCRPFIVHGAIKSMNVAQNPGNRMLLPGPGVLQTLCPTFDAIKLWLSAQGKPNRRESCDRNCENSW